MRSNRSGVLRAAAVVAGALFTASACSSGTDSNSASGGSSGSSSPAAQSLKGQTVEVAAVWTGTEQTNFKKVLDAFAQQTGATVTYTSTGDDIATVLGTRIQGGKVPDVALLPQPGLISEFAQRNALKPVPNDAAQLVDENFSPDWKALGSVNGKLYGIFFKAANKSTVWYRTAAFKEAGVQEPKTWDDLLKTAQTISDSGTTPVAVGGADGWTLTDWFENVYLRIAGPAKYDQLTKHTIPWTDSSVKQTLTTLGQLWGKQTLLVGGTKSALQTTFPQSVTQVFAANPKGAIVYEGDFVAGVISGETKSKPGTDAKFFDFPSVNGSAPSVVGGGDAAVMMKDTKGAQALMKFLATPEAAMPWAQAGGFTSPNKKLATTAYPDEISKKSAESLVSAQTFRFDMSDLSPVAFGGTPGQGEWKILQDFLRNPKNVNGTAAALEAAAAKAYKG